MLAPTGSAPRVNLGSEARVEPRPLGIGSAADTYTTYRSAKGASSLDVVDVTPELATSAIMAKAE
jgi:hypothetical protein